MKVSQGGSLGREGAGIMFKRSHWVQKMRATGEFSPYVGMNNISLRSTKTVFNDVQVLKADETIFIHSFLFFGFVLVMILCIYTEDWCACSSAENAADLLLTGHSVRGLLAGKRVASAVPLQDTQYKYTRIHHKHLYQRRLVQQLHTRVCF